MNTNQISILQSKLSEIELARQSLNHPLMLLENLNTAVNNGDQQAISNIVFDVDKTLHLVLLIENTLVNAVSNMRDIIDEIDLSQ